MTLKTLLLLESVCILVIAILGGHFITEYHSPPIVERIDLLMAGRDLPAGTEIQEPTRLFRRCALPKGTEPNGAVRDPYELLHRFLAKPLTAGQVITADDLTDRQNWMKSHPWPQEINIGVDAANVVGGFVLPQVRVDIQVIRFNPENGPVFEEVLGNALVLSVHPSRHLQSGAFVSIQVRSPEEQEQLRKIKSGDKVRLVVKHPLFG